jgi:C-terminal processing protease CtpA/Prc
MGLAAMNVRLRPSISFIARWLSTAVVLASLASCGGGGDDEPAVCSLREQKMWVSDMMNDAYFWYASKPDPDPDDYDHIDDYFYASLFRGDSTFPADRWSYTESTESYDQFFDEGKTLGYGFFVAALEVQDQPDEPLRIRYVEPASPAADAGLQRGDTLVSINGVAASNYIATGDYSLLTPLQDGERLDLVVRNAQGAQRSVSVVAEVYSLTPVSRSTVLSSPSGTKVGYVALKDFIDRAKGPLESAFAGFKSQGIDEIVLDLRYNGGGLVSVARDVASYAAGSAAASKTFTLLKFNDRYQDENVIFRFGSLASAMGAQRVFLLTGARTCSASELVVNGLEPFVQVVQIGDTTCGKPFGFVPQEHCGTTFSAVNFESVNALGQGRYWNGIAPHCPVADDLDHELGDPDEALTATALDYVDTGTCPSTSVVREQPLSLRRLLRQVDEGERRGMIVR